MKIVNTTDEKVLAAAKKCPVAKTTLETLFPEVFTDPREVNFGEDLSMVLCPRRYGNLAGKSVYLDSAFEWRLTKDDTGQLVLQPLKRIY